MQKIYGCNFIPCNLFSRKCYLAYNDAFSFIQWNDLVLRTVSA